MLSAFEKGGKHDNARMHLNIFVQSFTSGISNKNGGVVKNS